MPIRAVIRSPSAHGSSGCGRTKTWRSASTARRPSRACRPSCRELSAACCTIPRPRRSAGVRCSARATRRTPFGSPQADASLGFRDEFIHRMERSPMAARPLHFHEWREFQRSPVAEFRIHGEQCEIPAAAARRTRVESLPSSRATVIRAGFGMYNDLQDALGYRTDQNAPFNPTYSLPNVAVSSLPVSSVRRDSRHREAGARRRPAGSSNADTGLLVIPHRAGNHAPTPLSPSATSARTDITKSSASTPMSRFR